MRPVLELWHHVPREHLEARHAWLWEHDWEHRRLAERSGTAMLALDDLFVAPVVHDQLHRELAVRWETPGGDFASVDFEDPAQWMAWHHRHTIEHVALRNAIGG